jgi:hypothetical protein
MVIEVYGDRSPSARWIKRRAVPAGADDGRSQDLPSPRLGAVWFGARMGLLDDAIREHLELKRLRGADPGEVARAETDALGPVLREADEQVPEGEQEDPDQHEDVEPVSGTDNSHAEVGALVTDAPQSSSEQTVAGVGQETVEINMEAELEHQSALAETPASPLGRRAAPVGHPAHTRSSAGDLLEWEMPGDRKAHAEEEEPAEEEQASAEAPVEDVLEETPDFLRETPEQDRLWFEQRPPRDFDFNE